MHAMKNAALPRAARLCLGLALASIGWTAAPAAALLPQSWKGYKWARTGLLEIKVGNNLSAQWRPYLITAIAQWSADPIIDLVAVSGSSPTATCSPSFGTIQICNGDYGANGWLGYTNVWTSGGFIVQASIRINEHYLLTGKYAKTEWMSATFCHELGHSIGLDHADSLRTNANTGDCLDLSSDATGKLGTNGTLANIRPIASDFLHLDAIYATPGTTQLASTKPTGPQIGAGSYIDGYSSEGFGAVPEPASWALLIAGFGLVGASQRCRRSVAA